MGVARQQALRERAEEAEANKKAEVTHVLILRRSN